MICIENSTAFVICSAVYFYLLLSLGAVVSYISMPKSSLSFGLSLPIIPSLSSTAPLFVLLSVEPCVEVLPSFLLSELPCVDGVLSADEDVC